jgi:hypothetical protein
MQLYYGSSAMTFYGDSFFVLCGDISLKTSPLNTMVIRMMAPTLIIASSTLIRWLCEWQWLLLSWWLRFM